MRADRIAIGVVALALVACGDTAVEPHDPVVLTLVAAPPAEQGILVPMNLRVEAVNLEGEAVPDLEVTWEIQAGEGWLRHFGQGWQRDPTDPADRQTSLTAHTDEDGTSRVQWRIGPVVGHQEIRVDAPGAEPLVASLDARPGVVLVAGWNLDEEEQARLPSDTLRNHATFLPLIEESRQRFEAGDSLRLVGQIAAGPGVDPNWVFQIDPAHVHAAPPPEAWTGWCVDAPPFTEEDLEDILARAHSERLVCHWILPLVDIEEVPQWYLDDLLERRDELY